ncbi:MAG: hypothetical protein ACYTGB_12710 [Planctomycetota bacterium]
MRKLLAGMTLAATMALAGCGSDAPPDNAGEPGARPPGGGQKNGSGPDVDWGDKKPRVLIEAEKATPVAPYAVAQDAAASGGKYLTVASKGCDGNVHQHIVKDEKDPARRAGSAELEFEVKEAAEYVLWVRRWTCCSCGDSWTMQIDDGPAFTVGDQDITHQHWSWQAQQDADGKVKFKLTAGKHKLKFANRGESGFRIDQVLFWADHKHAPAGMEK